MTNGRIPECMPSGRPWPRITVVTPTFNRGHMLEATIRSVLDQRYPNLEYIVMDGDSADNTVEVIERYGDRIAYWESEKDRGQSHALNKGFARATGQLFTWLNSDDRYEPDALFSFALAHDLSGADLVAGMIQVLRDGTPDGFHLTSAAEANLLLSEMLDVDGTWNSGKFFYQPEVIFTRDIWNRAGGYVAEDLHYSMDYDLWCRMAAAGARLKVIGKTICAFLIHPDQKTLGNAAARFKSELKTDAKNLSKQYGIPPRYRRFGSALPRVCLVADAGQNDGSGTAIRRVATALSTAGHDIEIISLEVVSSSDTVVRHPKISEIVERIRAFRADVVIFGSIHGAGISPVVVTEVGKHFLTFLLPHDLWWLTGRSTFPLETSDPLESEDEDLRNWATYPRMLPGYIRQARLDKARVLSSRHAPIVMANSSWTREIYSRALGVIGTRKSMVSVSLGVTGAFKPGDKLRCREEFGLPIDKFVIATSAVRLDEHRKGMAILLEAIHMMADPAIVVACAGKMERPLEEPFQTVCVGRIDDDATMSRFYSAADIVVSASLMETLGQTLVEASASGVPTIAFAGSGTEDAVRNGVTGWLVKDLSAEALATAVRNLKADADLRADMAFWGPLFAANEFSIYKSYYSFYRAFEEVGLYAGGDFKRKIDFEQEPPTALQIRKFGHGISVQDYHGVSEELGPYTPLNIGKHRWVREHEASLEIYNGDSENQAKMILELRNYHDGQRMQLIVNDVVCLDEHLQSNFERKQLFEIDVWVPSGDSRVRINTTKIKPGYDGKPEAILIEGLSIV